MCARLPAAPPGRSFRLAGACAPGDTSAPDDKLALDLLEAEGYQPAPLPLAERFPHAGAWRAEAEPRPLGASLAARFGLIYIQDPSSMLPPLLLDPPPGACVLDVCASPGGKTGLLARLVGPQGFVLGNEPNPSRLDTLRRNLARSGLLNVATSAHPGQDLPLEDGAWGHVLLDPPCSGWGTADKHPKVMAMWSEDKTGPLVRLQRQLLERAARLLAPGGRLLYSTCTTNPAENEDQAAWAVEALGLDLLPLAPPPGFVLREPSRPEARGSLCVSPEQGASQGFFLALLRRPGPVTERGETFGEVAGEAAAGGTGEALSGYAAVTEAVASADRPDLPGEPLGDAALELVDLAAAPPGRVWRFGDKAVFVHQAALALLPPGLRWQGAPVGRVRGGVLQPDPLVRLLCPPLVPRDPGEDVELDDPADLARLLSGQSLDRPGDSPFPVLRHHGRSLGRLRRKGRRVLWTGKG